MVLTGLDLEAKAAFAQQQLFDILGGRSFAEADVRFLRFDTGRPHQRPGVRATADLRSRTPTRARSAGRFERNCAEIALRVCRLPHHHATHVGVSVRRVSPSDRAPVERDAGRGAAQR